MKRAEVLAILRGNQEQLRVKYGVKSLALFGSVARDEARADSDVDLLVEFARSISLFGLVDTARYVAALLGVAEDKVDLVIRDSVLLELQDVIYGEAVDVFHAASLEVPYPTHS
jgi:predicted nucleotidyltransferase